MGKTKHRHFFQPDHQLDKGWTRGTEYEATGANERNRTRFE